MLRDPDFLNIAVEGCCHGELDKIYETIQEAESKNRIKVDLLLVCGDFQCVRDFTDLQCVAMPSKYRKLNSFHEYISGIKKAPVTTVFIGGNHESSNILQSLYFGGYVAPNIYFLGFGGVIWFGGIRIAGLSGIFNEKHFRLGHFERPPYSEDTLRSIYHLRELEVFRMFHLASSKYPTDVFLSHDWPANIWEYGNKKELLRKKSFLQEDMTNGKLGSPPLMNILNKIQPSFWFASHLHVKFPAIVVHKTNRLSAATAPDAPTAAATTAAATRFLSLDKVLPSRDFLQFLRIPKQECNRELQIMYDEEWLAVLKRTNHFLQTSRQPVHLPTSLVPVSQEEISYISNRLNECNNGSRVIPPYPLHLQSSFSDPSSFCQPVQLSSPQTDALLSLLELPHIWTKPGVPPTGWPLPRPPPPLGPPPARVADPPAAGASRSVAQDANEIDLDNY